MGRDELVTFAARNFSSASFSARHAWRDPRPSDAPLEWRAANVRSLHSTALRVDHSTRMRRTLFSLLVCAVWLSTALPAQRRLPAPAAVFGFEPGADNKLATYDQVVDYFKRVDAASDRVRLVEAGTSTQGRTYYFALVSSKKNLERVDHYREIARRLAHPEGLTDQDARRLAREGKAFVHIDGGLHSTEFAGPQHTPLLLDDLLTRLDAGDEDVEEMFDDVILMLWPTINPDGHQMTAEWHMQRAGTAAPNEPMPALYQEFVGHDNNRDGYMLNMIESRVMEHTWRQWEPNIIYVHHQSAPFPTRIWLPPFAEPIALHTPYIVSRELNMIGMAIARRLDAEGKVGATHMGSGYDAWYPGYVDYAPAFKNIPAFWTETQGRGAAPTETRREQIAADMQRPQSLYSSPWLGGRWTLRDQVEYMKTASIATLEYAAKYKDSLLYGRYLAGKAQIAKGRSEPPYAYVVPQAQRDPVAAVEMLRRLAFAGVRVYRLTSDETIEGERFPEGTWIVPADQEFAALAREVLDVQKYPEIRESPGGPLDQPYDAAGWTLPLSMGVRTVYVQTPLSDDVRRRMKLVADPAGEKIKPSPYTSARNSDAQPFDTVPGIGFDSEPMARAIVPPAGRITGSGPALAVNPAENNAFKAINRAWKAGATVRFDAWPLRDLGSGRSGAGIAGRSAGAQRRARRRNRGRAAAASRWPVPRQHQHGRGLDALGPGAVRVSVHARVGRRHSGRIAARPDRRAGRSPTNRRACWAAAAAGAAAVVVAVPIKRRRTTPGLPRSRHSSATAARSSASTAAPTLPSAVSSCR